MRKERGSELINQRSYVCREYTFKGDRRVGGRRDVF